jgi:hypothetical protein
MPDASVFDPCYQKAIDAQLAACPDAGPDALAVARAIMAAAAMIAEKLATMNVVLETRLIDLIPTAMSKRS